MCCSSRLSVCLWLYAEGFDLCSPSIDMSTFFLTFFVRAFVLCCFAWLALVAAFPSDWKKINNPIQAYKSQAMLLAITTNLSKFYDKSFQRLLLDRQSSRNNFVLLQSIKFVCASCLKLNSRHLVGINFRRDLKKYQKQSKYSGQPALACTNLSPWVTKITVARKDPLENVNPKSGLVGFVLQMQV